jgi:hypothetical protein
VLSKKQIRFEVDETLIFFFLVNGHSKFTYALSTSKIKVMTYQYFNLNYFLTQFQYSISKIFLTYFYYTKVFQTLYIIYYKLNIVHHDGLKMIEKILILLSCIYV